MDDRMLVVVYAWVWGLLNLCTHHRRSRLSQQNHLNLNSTGFPKAPEKARKKDICKKTWVPHSGTEALTKPYK